MDIKKQIKEDIWRLVFALIIPPFVVSGVFAGFLSYGFADPAPAQMFHGFVFSAFLVYSIPALSAYAYAIKNSKTSFMYYAVCGIVSGILAGPAFLYLLGAFRISHPIALVAVILGSFSGFFFSFFFWAYAVSKGYIVKIISLIMLPVYVWPSIFLTIVITGLF